MGAIRLLGTLGIILAVLLASIHQIYVKPALKIRGVGRGNLPNIGSRDCITEPALEACEDMSLASDGTLYLACSSRIGRSLWQPTLQNLNGTGSGSDYFASYDPATRSITHLQIDGFHHAAGFSLHGIDVVQKPNSQQLFLYAINHRAEDPKGINEKGANSVIEIFTTREGSDTLLHLYTVEHPLITTPNSVVGTEEGKGFYFTNDHGMRKIGWKRQLRLLGIKSGTIGYCHVEHGCSLATTRLVNSANGLTRSRTNNTIYVGSSAYGGVSVFEERGEGKLGFREIIPTEYPIDNLSVDDNGALWAAAFPKAVESGPHLKSPFTTNGAPSAAIRIAQNTGPGAFYGEKYKMDIVFQEDGSFAPGSTVVVNDVRRHKLYIHGLVAPHLSICNV